MRRFYCLLALIVVYALTACGRSSGPEQNLDTRPPNAVTPTPAAPENGTEVPAAETPRAGKEQIQRAVERQFAYLELAFRRVQHFYDEASEVQSQKTTLLRVLQTSGIYKDLAPLERENRFLTVLDKNAKPLFERLFKAGSGDGSLYKKTSAMRFRYQEEPCEDETKSPGEMSAKKNGFVCVSYKRLRFVPPLHLDMQVLALLAMESSQLMGFNKADATMIKDWFLSNTNVVSENERLFNYLELLMRESIFFEGGLLEVASRRSFDTKQFDAAFNKVMGHLGLIKLLFLEHRTIQLPILLEHRLYKVFAGLSVDFDRNDLGGDRITEPAQITRQLEYRERIKQLQDETLHAYNQIRTYRRGEIPLVHYPRIELGWRHLTTLELQTLAGNTTPKGRVVCTLVSADKASKWEGVIRPSQPNTELRPNERNLVPVGQGQKNLGALEITYDPHSTPFFAVLFYFHPKADPKTTKMPWQITVEDETQKAVFPSTKWVEDIPLPGLFGALDKDKFKTFQAKFTLSNPSLKASVPYEVQCRTDK